MANNCLILSKEMPTPNFRKGFTLLELIIVIAVLGVLATVLLIAINPAQQFARGRDTGRISAVTQLGRAMEAYGTSHAGTYLAEGSTWVTGLVTGGEITKEPPPVNYSQGPTACSTNAQNGYCYDASSPSGAGPFVVFARLESASNISKCTAGQWIYAVYSSADGQAGFVCKASGGAPTPGSQTFTE